MTAIITGIATKYSPVSQDDALKQALSSAIRDPLLLLKKLNLDQSEYIAQLNLEDKFKLFVPLSYVNKMKKEDWHDPLLRQVLPLKNENKQLPDFVMDPVGDLDAQVSSGLLHKYHGRVLLITTGACAVHCRYCFRRHFPYSEALPDKEKWQQTLARINGDTSIHEVILSGGDPLMIPDERLSQMCFDLAKIPHVKTLRFHSRVPIFLPERISQYFLRWLDKLDVKTVMVIHANHANEIDDTVCMALKQLSNVGVTLLNQSVLLKNINDNAKTLAQLSLRLFECGILPYYLHKLDKVQGATHFDVSIAEAKILQIKLNELLPGYLVPRFVTEVSGKRSKQPLV